MTVSCHIIIQLMHLRTSFSNLSNSKSRNLAAHPCQSIPLWHIYFSFLFDPVGSAREAEGEWARHAAGGDAAASRNSRWHFCRPPPAGRLLSQKDCLMCTGLKDQCNCTHVCMVLWSSKLDHKFCDKIMEGWHVPQCAPVNCHPSDILTWTFPKKAKS